MAPVIGFALLLLIISVGIFLPVFCLAAHKKVFQISNSEIKKVVYALVAITFACALLSQLCLIYSFIVSDYSVSNVYKNSHHLKPIIYKISGSWGNHEGSMLLVISTLSAYTFAFTFFSKIEIEKKIITSVVQSSIIALFAAFTAFTSNPFARIFPTPNEGLGLNPILQDIGLALHPPMLYAGYIGFSLTFSLVIAALLNEKIDEKFTNVLRHWLFLAYGFLTLGIGLGSWWAYRELGWGGYWFWDPVENISLMPWIAATSLLHCLMTVERKKIFQIWMCFLAILTFILCLLGIFLTRSGVLTSVHAFAIDMGRGFFIIILIALIGGAGLLVLGSKSNKLSQKSLNKKNDEVFLQNFRQKFISKTNLILFNNYFLMIALFVVLLGTIYPIFLRGFFDEFITIGPNYYNAIFSILIAPFLIFLALSSNNFSTQNKFLNKRNYLILLASLTLTSLTFFYEQSANFLQVTILFLAILASLMLIFSASQKFWKKNLVMNGAHLGFALVIIGIILTSSFGLTKEVNLQKNQSLKIAGYELNFVEVTYLVGKNFLARQGNFLIKKDGVELGKLEPQLRYYAVADQTTNETSIRHGSFGDLYLVIGNKDEKENYAVRAYYKPFIYLIWFGCFLIFASVMFAVSRGIFTRLEKD